MELPPKIKALVSKAQEFDPVRVSEWAYEMYLNRVNAAEGVVSRLLERGANTADRYTFVAVKWARVPGQGVRRAWNYATANARRQELGVQEAVNAAVFDAANLAGLSYVPKAFVGRSHRDSVPVVEERALLRRHGAIYVNTAALDQFDHRELVALMTAEMDSLRFQDSTVAAAERWKMGSPLLVTAVPFALAPFFGSRPNYRLFAYADGGVGWAAMLVGHHRIGTRTYLRFERDQALVKRMGDDSLMRALEKIESSQQRASGKRFRLPSRPDWMPTAGNAKGRLQMLRPLVDSSVEHQRSFVELGSEAPGQYMPPVPPVPVALLERPQVAVSDVRTPSL